MPLDNTGIIIDPPTISSLDPLTRMGVTPVPDDFVRDYKTQYRENWLRENDYGAGKPGPFEWRTRTHQDWIQFMSPYHRKASDRSLENFLNSSFWMEDPTKAPKKLVNLAIRVQQTIPDAAFSVDYFYTDPVLNVCYSVGEISRTACLGIWDHGVLKAIADHQLAPVSVPSHRWLPWLIPSIGFAIMLVATALTWS